MRTLKWLSVVHFLEYLNIFVERIDLTYQWYIPSQKKENGNILITKQI